MNIYIVHRDIDWEMGDVMDVCTYLQAAKRVAQTKQAEGKTDPDEWSIQWWVVGEGEVSKYRDTYYMAAEDNAIVWKRKPQPRYEGESANRVAVGDRTRRGIRRGATIRHRAPVGAAPGCSSAWQSASFGTTRSAVQICAPRPPHWIRIRPSTGGGRTYDVLTRSVTAPPSARSICCAVAWRCSSRTCAQTSAVSE